MSVAPPHYARAPPPPHGPPSPLEPPSPNSAAITAIATIATGIEHSVPPPPPMPTHSPPPGERDAGTHNRDRVEAPLSLADLLRDQALARGQVPSPSQTNPPGVHHPSPLRRWAHAMAHPWRSSSASVNFYPSSVPAHTTSPPVSAPPSPISSPRLPRMPLETPKKEVSFLPSRQSRSTSSPIAVRSQHAHSWIPSSLKQASLPPPPPSPKPRPPRSSSLLPSASVVPALLPASDRSEEAAWHSDSAPFIAQDQTTPPKQEQLGPVRWAGVLCAPVGAQAGWAFKMVYASPLLLSAGLNLTQVASVWFSYVSLSLIWRMLVPCIEADATDMPRARRDLATATLVSVLGLVGLGKIDALANQLARLGGGVGDWDPDRIEAREGAGQVVLICALGVLEVGIQRMGYAAHALVTHVPQAWVWASQMSHHTPISPTRVGSWVPGAVTHFAAIAGFVLAGARLNNGPRGTLDWLLSPPSDPEEESEIESQVRRLCALLIILLSVSGCIAWLASGPPIKPPQTPMEPESPLPPPPPVPRRGGARISFWSVAVPAALRPSPRGGVKRAVAQVGDAIRAKTMDPRQKKVYVAQLLSLAAWCPFVWFGSTFALLVQRGYEKDRHRFRPGPPSAFAIQSNMSGTNGTLLDVPSVAWTFASFAIFSALTSCSIYYISTHPGCASPRPSTAWTLASLLAGAGLMASLLVRTPIETGVWLSILGIPWSLLSALPKILGESSRPSPPVCTSEPEIQAPMTSSDPPSPQTQGGSIRARPTWPGPERHLVSDQQRLSWRSSIIRASQDATRAGSQQSGRTSALSHATHAPPGSLTTMPVPIPSSQDDVRPPEALARAREKRAGFAFRPTDEGASPASVSFSSPALRNASLPGQQGRNHDKLPSPDEDDDQMDLPRDTNNLSSDFGSSPARSSIDEESLTSSYSTDGAHRPIGQSFLTSTPPPGLEGSPAPTRRPVTPPSPSLPAPSTRSGSARGSMRAIETASKRSGVPSLHSIRTAMPERPSERMSGQDDREDRAPRQAVAKALTHCGPLPARASRVKPSDPAEPSKDLPESWGIFPPAGPFEMGVEGGLNPRLVRLPPLTIMSLFLIAVSYLTSDPAHPHFGGRWPVLPAWLLALGGVVACVAAWVVPRPRRRVEGDTA